jgi:uncharacterized protein (DUF305 family)
MRTRAARLTGAAVVAFATAACGGSTAPPPAVAAPGATPAAPVFNQVDVDFVAHMSQHHGQALLMTELAARKARSPEVKQLATRISQIRAPEIDRFGAWLAAWGEAGAEMPPHGIGGEHNGPGMLKEAEVERLGAVSAQRFDRTFLDLMVSHHRGGMQLTKAEVARGRNPEAVQLARDIRASATTAVSQMLEIKKALS